jgi:hypothetical protein
MKKLMLAIFLPYLSSVSSAAIAEGSAIEQKVEPSLIGQSFCGIREHKDAPDKKTESLFETDVFQSHFDKDCLLAVGFKGWANTWSLPIWFKADSTYAQDIVTLFESGSEFTKMPTLTFRYKNFYLSANHFAKTSYSFGTHKIYNVIPDTGKNSAKTTAPAFVKVSPTAERSEWDLTVGYYLNEYLALTVGYKKIKRTYEFGTKSDEVQPEVGTRSDDVQLEAGAVIDGSNSTLSSVASSGSGVAIGVIGAVPVKGKLSLYGNMVYGWLNTTETATLASKTERTEYDSPYYSSEVGFAYQLAHFKKVGLSCYLGYRFQRYEFENVTSSGQTARDGTDGFIASISAYF